MSRSRVSAPKTTAPRVVHLTSAHPSDDPRIFAKQCRSLAAAGYDVHLVAPGADRVGDGVRVWGVAKPVEERRALRMTRTVVEVARRAVALDADVYHLHDPELVPVGLALAAAGRKVVYDAHEDLPGSVLLKDWIRPRLRATVAGFARGAERLAARRFAAVVAATPPIAEQFESIASRIVVVSNFPRLEEFATPVDTRADREPAVCYVGSISENRGVRVMLDAVAEVDVTLLLAGFFSPPDLRERLARHPGWLRVTALGQLDRTGVADTIARSRAGLSVLAPVPTYVTSQPTKVYEYMAAGVPVIASNFALWRTIVDDNRAGITVDPTDASAVASAIRWVLEHPDEAHAMGRNGRIAVEHCYSWKPEARKLLALYADILG
jgi:glycosyltransferase involved in cell wall biosynthesis